MIYSCTSIKARLLEISFIILFCVLYLILFLFSILTIIRKLKSGAKDRVSYIASETVKLNFNLEQEILDSAISGYAEVKSESRAVEKSEAKSESR
ncbi:hypothetical protein TorRG33x02_144680 [Trema orientale]|uniref:Transmembrane protein n=1 Tax=Trema orientale TaxID=63057 RepID=A0A2P5EW77_TREOI|nr:hypothetical protein TorRG33x02_144680 [Trema orientale]